MGCGGSRADAIEPRYYESWTRETESTWLTNTDTDTPLPVISNGCNNNANESSALDKGSMHVFSNTSEGATQTHPQVTVSSSMHEKASTDKKTSTIGTNTHSGKHQLTHVPGTTIQKRLMFRTDEKKKRDANKMPAKEVSIHVTKSICSIESDGRKMENYMK
ncbi:brain and acute leukemia cytoplasmic protein-like [Heptranchias perlo]|uniref:brain and acute leukemia cytoplasmic protein-like n=1 Tax=Heptranchias perlo TaxID=212740 RepID=UPI00355A6F87